jgi:hypothetical protein
LTWVNDPPAASPTKPCTLTGSKNVNCEGQKRQGRADSLNGLGTSLRALGQHERASSCLRAALEIFEELQTPEAEGVRALLRRLHPEEDPLPGRDRLPPSAPGAVSSE